MPGDQEIIKRQKTVCKYLHFIVCYYYNILCIVFQCLYLEEYFQMYFFIIIKLRTFFVVSRRTNDGNVCCYYYINYVLQCDLLCKLKILELVIQFKVSLKRLTKFVFVDLVALL